MIEDYHNKRRQDLSRTRSIMDYVMGILFVLLGLYFLLYRVLGINLMGREPSNLDYAIGGLFLLYGGWRIYRGYKKNYFNEP